MPHSMMFILPQGEMQHPHQERGFVTHAVAHEQDGATLQKILDLKERYNAAGIDVAVAIGTAEVFCGCRACRKIDLVMSAKLARHEGRMRAFESCMAKLAEL